ncbi:hypothetical protein ACQPVP_10230 [Clostridium nigeriense]|uniref:hypothetical protein n=1 Tax=Clostridium nigeriense TaxID=1805470 RepID=UPI003D32CD90
MEIIISDGSNGENFTIDLKDIEGYNPRIIIGKYNFNSLNDILFIVENKNEEGITALLYTLDREKFIKIFDSNEYNKDKFKVIYSNGYIVNLINNKNNEKYRIDIRNKEKKYIDEKYNENGNLKKILIGDVLSMHDIASVRNKNEEMFDLLIKQRIIGENINDILGEIITVLRFDDMSFEDVDTIISIVSSNGGNKSIRKNKTKDETIDFSNIDFIESEYKANLRIERALEKEFLLNPNCDNLRYLYNRIKLKDSNKYQILVYLEGPKFCTENGGTLVVIEEKNNSYIITSRIRNIINPIIVSENISNGYKDLIVKVINRGKEELRVLKYNGNSYPINPLKEEKLKKNSKVRGVSVISDDLFYIKGIEY